MQQQGRNDERNLRRDLGLIPATALVVGMVIGSGIFMKPGKVILAAGDSTLALAAWVIGGLITLAAGLTIAELGVQIPKTGGLYACLDEVYGKFWGYLFGWVQTVIYGPALVGALGLYFSSLLIPFFSSSEELKLPLAIGTILFLSAVNSLGTRYGGMIQSAATVAKLVPIALIVVFGLWKGNAQILSMPSGASDSAGMGAAVLATLWAYDGWIGVGFVAGEMKNPAQMLPRAIIIGLGTVMVAYLAINLALLHVLPAAEIVTQGKLAAGSAATWLFGDVGGKLINIGILISIFGALNGYILTCPRVSYAMALRGQLPASSLLSQTSRFGTPLNAIGMQFLLAVLFVTVGDPDRLTDLAMFIIWGFYILGFAAIFILRRKTSPEKRPYSVPAFPLVPVIAIVGSVYIVISTIMNNPTDAILALGITAAGIPLYWLLNHMGKQQSKA